MTGNAGADTFNVDAGTDKIVDLTTNDMDSLISHFIANFSKNDSKTIHANIWKRIIKCVDKLIS